MASRSTRHFILKRPTNSRAPYVRGKDSFSWYTPNLAEAKKFNTMTELVAWVNMYSGTKTTDFAELQVIRVVESYCITESEVK